MSTPFIGQIMIVAFNFAPRGWAFANGQTLPINQNQALFSLFGTMYGGNGTTTFQLPNLQASVPMGVGNGYIQGQFGGSGFVTLTTAELPAHTHTASCDSAAGTAASPSGEVWAADGNGNLPYSTAGGAAMAPAAIANAGGGQAHENEAPYLTVSFCVALAGIFPART